MPHRRHHVQTRDDVAVREHRPLGASGRARRVLQQRQVRSAAPLDGSERRMSERGVERSAGRARLPDHDDLVERRKQVSHGERPVGEPVEREGDPRPGIGEEVAHLLLQVHDVHRHHHASGHQDAAGDVGELGPVVDLKRDPVAGADPVLGEESRHAARAFREGTERDGLSLVNERRFVGHRPGGDLGDFGQGAPEAPERLHPVVGSHAIFMPRCSRRSGEKRGLRTSASSASASMALRGDGDLYIRFECHLVGCCPSNASRLPGESR